MSQVIRVPVSDDCKLSGTGRTEYHLKFSQDRVVGNGSFGVVFEARVVQTGEHVAIKKVLQDKRFKNRELQIMKTLDHPNIVSLKHYFYQTEDSPDEVFLNLVMDYVPDTVYKVTRQYTKMRQLPPMLIVKLYVYQMCRSLAYLHGRGICHRDIKPQNLLVDSRSHVLKICDFGSAKALTPGEASVAYICSRYYRAPELIFGCTDYTSAIDVWSSGCVFAEMMLGHPLFPGESGVDQIVEIIKVLGAPSKEELEAMNPSYTDFKFPQFKPYPWSKVFVPKPPPEALDLLSRMLTYSPHLRITATEAMLHPFFDELRQPDLRLPDGSPLPPLFNFSHEEFKFYLPEAAEKLIPPHARNPSNWTGPLPPAAGDTPVTAPSPLTSSIASSPTAFSPSYNASHSTQAFSASSGDAKGSLNSLPSPTTGSSAGRFIAHAGSSTTALSGAGNSVGASAYLSSAAQGSSALAGTQTMTSRPALATSGSHVLGRSGSSALGMSASPSAAKPAAGYHAGSGSSTGLSSQVTSGSSSSTGSRPQRYSPTHASR